jgi:hypothetical protein
MTTITEQRARELVAGGEPFATRYGYSGRVAWQDGPFRLVYDGGGFVDGDAGDGIACMEGSLSPFVVSAGCMVVWNKVEDGINSDVK